MAAEDLQFLAINDVVNSYQALRFRPESEMETVTVPVIALQPHGGRPPFADPSKVHLRSQCVKNQRAVIQFTNTTASPVQIIWLDFHGNEVLISMPHSVLAPNTTSRFRSHVTHVWVARDAATGARLMTNKSMAYVVANDPEDQAVKIASVPKLEWTRAAHRHFPAAFKAATRAFLLAHHCSMQVEDQEPNAFSATSSPRSHSPGTPKSRRLEDLSPACAPDPSVPCGAQQALSLLSSDLVLHILSFTIPDDQVQHPDKEPHGHPDIHPILLNSDPSKWAPMAEVQRGW